jgi:[amino group carrier protein]-lysine/ornithine hydrolase
MIELLEECVRIRSLSGQERPVAEFLRDQMAARGFDRAFVDEAGNAVGIIGNGPRQIVLLGHMDTVDGEVPVRYDNGALYGRGTVDAKGPLCAFVLAAARLTRKDDRPPTMDDPVMSPSSVVGRPSSDWQLIVIGATEEEAASSKGARYAATQYRPELCVIGEPSGAEGITLGYKGRLLVEARFEQPSRHTAMPGPTAGEQAVQLWNWTDAFARQFNAGKPRAFDQILPALRHICSGDDGMLEWCDLHIGLRLPMEMGPHEMQREYEAAFADGGRRTEDGPTTGATVVRRPSSVVFRGPEQAYRSSKDSPLARAFVDAIRAEGARPAFKLKTGTADFNVVGPIWQCPMVAYGPGDSSLDHTPVEHVEVAEFEKSVRVLERMLRSVMGNS